VKIRFAFIAAFAVLFATISVSGFVQAQQTSPGAQQPSPQTQQPPETQAPPPSQSPQQTGQAAPGQSTPDQASRGQSSPSQASPSPSTPGTQQTPGAATPTPDASGSKEFVGTVLKQGDKFVLQETATGTTYDIDHQDEVKKFEGKKVRVKGTLDSSTKTIHVQ
jgi:hypothetical protein